MSVSKNQFAALVGRPDLMERRRRDPYQDPPEDSECTKCGGTYVIEVDTGDPFDVEEVECPEHG